MNFEDRLRQAFDEIAERLREDVQRELHAAIPAITRQLGEPAAAVASPSAAAASPDDVAAAFARLLASVREIDDATSLTGVLETLLWGVVRETSRASLFLVQGEHLVLWRSRGFGDGDAQHRAQPLQIAFAEGGVAADAVSSRNVVLTEAVDRMPVGLAAPSSFGGAAAGAIHVGGQVAAVLYADREADNNGEATRQMALTVELLSRHASRCLEAITAFRTAQLFTEPASSDNGQRSARWDMTADPNDWAEDDAESARRYARLLISEIKLYHEHAVIAGRRDRNLASRLGGEIARARAMYEQRVSRELDRRTDYFDAEVVRTLANGDVSLLGVTN